MAGPAPEPTPTRAALAATLAAWGAEVLLVRASSSPVVVVDLVASFVGFALAFAVVSRFGSSLAARFVARAPLALLVGGIAGVPIVDRGGSWLVLAAVTAVAAFATAWFGRANQLPALPAPVEVAGWAAASAALGWAADGEAPPIAWITVWAAGLVLVAATARVLPVLAAIGVAVSALLPTGAPAPVWGPIGSPAAGPDLILVTVDTLRYDRTLGGARPEPRLESLVSQHGAAGEAVAAAPWTLPSMATLLTGLPLDAHRAVRHHDGSFGVIAAEIDTVAERLAAAGYDTAAVVAPNPWIGSAFGFDQGFAWFDHRRDATRGALPRGKYPGGRARPVLGRFVTALGWAVEPDLSPAADVVDRALAVVRARRRERPLFLWVHLLDPHLPYSAPTDAPPGVRVALSRVSRREVVGGRSGLDPTWLTAGYDAEVAAVDDALAGLFAGLGPAGGRGRVLLVTADHGEELGDHGGWEHGHALWQEVVSVPLVLVGRDWRAEAPASHLDVATTLLAAAGAPTEGLHGRDLGRPGAAPRMITANLMHGDDPWGAIAARKGRWKAVRTTAGDRLYDVVADPGETLDVSGQHPGRVEDLLGAVSLPTPGARADVRAEQGLLEALGYRDADD